jgi:amino acid transporter
MNTRKPRSRRLWKNNYVPQDFGGMMSRPKEVLVGLCLLASGVMGMVIAIYWMQALLGPLRSGDPVIETRSTTFGFPLVVLAVLGLGLLVLLGAARSPWAFRHIGTLFGGILASLVLGVALMIGGDLVNGVLLRHHGYEICDSKGYYRMTTNLWATQERGCGGVDYLTSRPI